MNRRQVVRALPLIAVGLGSSACGYALAGHGSFLPAYIKSLGIPMFGNQTPYLSVEQLFTQKVREEFQSSGRYTVVPSDTGVDAIIHGDIVSISPQPVGFTDVQLASRYRWTITVKVKFDDVKQGTTLWENPALSFSDEYEVSTPGAAANAAAFVGQERSALDRMSTDFARNVVSAILEAF